MRRLHNDSVSGLGRQRKRRVAAPAGACLALAACLFFAGSPALAQEYQVTAEMQLSLFSRLLPFDRNFRERVGEEAVIGILYQRSVRQSVNVKNALLEALERQPLKRISDIPTRVVVIEYFGMHWLSEHLEAEEVDILYIAPLRSVSLDELKLLCLQRGVGTITGVPDYVDNGVAVGIGARGNRPEIVVNLTAARAQGFDFSSQLLRLAKVLQ